MNIEINTTCLRNDVWHVVFEFIQSSVHGQVESCSNRFQSRIKCGNLTYGMIDYYWKQTTPGFRYRRSL